MEWRCTSCEQWRNHAAFTKTQLKDQTKEVRRCHECVLEEESTEYLKLTQLQCDGPDCKCIVDIAGFSPMDQKNRRKRDQKTEGNKNERVL